MPTSAPPSHARPAAAPRTATLVVNRRCNQACTFCSERGPEDTPATFGARAIAAALRAALASGATELCLTGGEPTLRADLELLVSAARRLGAARIVLETNATLITGPRARSLRDAGVTCARVHLAGWGDAADAVTRDPGGFAATLAGLRALAEIGVPFEIVAVVCRSTRASLPGLVRELARSPGLRPRALVLSVPERTEDPDELLSLADAARTVSAVEREARVHEIPTKLRAPSGLTPCLFEPGARPSHLFSLHGGSSDRRSGVRVAACGACDVEGLCAGLPAEPLGRHGEPPLSPIRGEKARRRLTLVGSVEAQIERELVSPNLLMTDAGPVYEEIVRTNFHCNQACRFCFVSTHLPAATADAVRAAIESAGRRGARITLSGGEPTLNPLLPEYVRLARAVSSQPVQLQTNAVRLDDPALVEELVGAGLEEAFVSLHGSTAEIADAVTEAPGTFARTCVGVDNLARAGVRLTLNYVVCAKNLRDLGATVRLIASRWPAAELSISFVAPSTDLVPRDPALVPSYTEALPVIAAATAEAERLGVRVTGFESMCGLPLCLVPGSRERYAGLPEIPPGFDRGEFLKTETCDPCAFEAKCYGVRRGYAALYGTAELRRVDRT